MQIVFRVLYWIVTIPYTLIIAFFAIGTPYCAVAFVQGGLPRVKSWLIHIQIEGVQSCTGMKRMTIGLGLIR
jgi:hypothetical protein